MLFPMKIQPIDGKGVVRADAAKPVAKSRLKRLFERQFPGVLRISSAEKLAGGSGDPEPSSVCLDKMVQSFMEETTDKPSSCGRHRCNCFHGNGDDSSDDEADAVAGDPPAVPAPSGDALEIIKGLTQCVSVAERNLLADVSSIVERSKTGGSGKRKDDCRRIVADGLRALGYDAAICKSRWEKSTSIPAGEYAYVDVAVEGERVVVEVDFRSEFEIARSTKGYRAVLQALPAVFVGRGDRLQQIVAVASEAARQSLRKKGLHLPPWRKPEYMRAKWLSPSYERSIPPSKNAAIEQGRESGKVEGASGGVSDSIAAVDFSGVVEQPIATGAVAEENSVEVEASKSVKAGVVASPWEPPAVMPKSAGQRGGRVVAGLASVLRENP